MRIGSGVGAGAQRNARKLQGSETGRDDRDLLIAWLQGVCLILASRVGFFADGRVGGKVGYGDGSGRNSRAAGIGYDPADGAEIGPLPKETGAKTDNSED